MISPNFGPNFRLRKVLPEALTIATISLVQFTGTLQFWEWAVFDTMLRLRPAEPKDERVVIVGIQEADIRKMGYPVSDRDLAQLVKTIQTYQPAVIGVDIFRDLPVQPGHAELVQTFRSSPNLIAINKVLPSTVNPPPGMADKNLGFVDAIFDDDGKLRRSLLVTSIQSKDTRVSLSLSLRLAAAYLKTKGKDLDKGFQDPSLVRFGSTELPRFQGNSGGYVRANAWGNQMLINFRSGADPFPILTLQDLQRGVDSSRLRGKIVLIGMMAPSVKDVVTTSAIVTKNAALVYGVEAQAHAVSQIVSGVEDGRPLLTSWWDGCDYLWIGAWGILGVVLGRSIRSPFRSLLALALAGFCLVMGSYGLLILGWWIPVVPAALALALNGVALSAFYRYDEALRSRLHDRQLTIDQTFNAIHNGPLQTLALLLRTVQETELSQSQLLERLHYVNQELRDVYEVVQREVAAPVAGGQQEVNVTGALHESLHEVYSVVLERDFPGFKTLKIKVVKFDPLNDRQLSTDQKRGLCRFLEEALCNVGKHAIDPTRLEILCTQSDGQNRIRVTDNGKGAISDCLTSSAAGMGTQQASKLAKQLGGSFRRWPNEICCMSCELTWSGKRVGLFRF